MLKLVDNKGRVIDKTVRITDLHVGMKVSIDGVLGYVSGIGMLNHLPVPPRTNMYSGSIDDLWVFVNTYSVPRS